VYWVLNRTRNTNKSVDVASLTLLYAILLALTLIAYFLTGYTFTLELVFTSAAISVLCVVVASIKLWKGKVGLSPPLLSVGVAYWFWVEAIQLALQEPRFTRNDINLYPFLPYTLPDDIVLLGVICVNMFSLFMFLGLYLPIPTRAITKYGLRHDKWRGVYLDNIAVLLALLGWLPPLVELMSFSDTIDALLKMRGEGGIEGVLNEAGLLRHFSTIGILGGALALTRLVIGGRDGSRGMQILAIVISLPPVFLGLGSRFNLAYLLLPALIVLLSQLRHTNAKATYRARALLLAGLVIVGVLLQGSLRTRGLSANEISQVASEETSLLAEGFVGHEHFTALLYAVDLVERRGSVFMEPQLPFFLIHFIPRQIWPGKPIIASWEIYNAAVSQSFHLNVTPSVIGQYYMNWWFFGVAFVGLLFGWIGSTIDYWLNSLSIRENFLASVVAALFLAFLFLSFRMLHPLYFVYPAIAFCCYYLMSTPPLKTHIFPERPGQLWRLRR